MVNAINKSHAEVTSLEKGVESLQARLRQVKKDKDEEKEMIQEKEKAKAMVNEYHATISSKKLEIEKLLLDNYGKYAEIKLPE